MLLTFFFVFKEMLGVWLWPLIFVLIFFLLSFLLLLVYEKKLVSIRFKYSLWVGLIGGIFGVVFLMLISKSTGLSDIGGPLDWVLLIGTFVGGYAAGTVLFYTFFGWFTALRSCNCKLSANPY